MKELAESVAERAKQDGNLQISLGDISWGKFPDGGVWQMHPPSHLKRVRAHVLPPLPCPLLQKRHALFRKFGPSGDHITASWSV
jgi:hypothetical protein